MTQGWHCQAALEPAVLGLRRQLAPLDRVSAGGLLAGAWQPPLTRWHLQPPGLRCLAGSAESSLTEQGRHSHGSGGAEAGRVGDEGPLEPTAPQGVVPLLQPLQTCSPPSGVWPVLTRSCGPPTPRTPPPPTTAGGA